VQVNHHHRAEDRRDEVQHRHENETCQNGAGGEHRAPVLGAQARHLLRRPEAARRQFEIFAPQQIGVGDEERPDVDSRNEEQEQGGKIDQKR
jgi:hypothetical protein